jgi:hypothetical protein
LSRTKPSTTEGKVARLFGLSGEHWMRHANPLSVWTRFSVPSLLAVSVWSRVWIGWYSLIAVAISIVWMVVNPLFFDKPRSTKNWASKSVLGERIWTERKQLGIPGQFVSPVPNLANAYSGLGLIALAYGLVAVEVWPVVAGVVILHGGKLWYLDRMVLLFEDMKSRDPQIASWEY